MGLRMNADVTEGTVPAPEDTEPWVWADHYS